MKDFLTYNLQRSVDYPNHKINIQKWIAESKEMVNYIHKFVIIQKETEKAYAISFDNLDEKEYWIPKSQCEIVEIKDSSLFIY